MSESFVNHPLESEGLIRLSDSIDKTADSRTRDFDDIQYMLLDPHGSENLRSVPKKAWEQMPKDRGLVQTLANLEKDGAVPELADEILRKRPNGLLLNVDIAKILFDANRHPEFALGRVLGPVPPDNVRGIVLTMHNKVLRAIYDVMAKLPRSAKVVLLHSMYPNEEIEDTGDIDISTEDGIRRYTQIQEASVGTGAPRDIDMIRGDKGTPPIDDPEMCLALEEGFSASGKTWNENEPHATTKGRHKSGDYMEARPGNVVCVDIPEDQLCHGIASNRSFELVGRTANPDKIAAVAQVFVEALNRCIRAA